MRPSLSPIVSSDGDWQSHPLPTGRLEVRARQGVSLHELCTFAARRNPRRGFLFVSRLLGRYMPVRPSDALAAHRALADRLPRALPGPVVFVGVAEAGIALAHGVYDTWRKRQLGVEHMFLHSTRHFESDAPVALRFEEPHSHAPSHLVHEPSDPLLADRLDRARSVVLVDDELTTGTTFGRFVESCTLRLPRLERCLHLVLTSWRETPMPARLHGVDIELHALAEAQYRWTPSRRVEIPPGVEAFESPQASLPSTEHGRFGLSGSASMPRLPTVGPEERVLVLGTEEYQYPALQVAAALEAEGVRAHFAATTRAPVLVGGGIQHCSTLPDAYDEGRTTYLYNAPLESFDRVVVVTDGPARALSRKLAEENDVELVFA